MDWLKAHIDTITILGVFVACFVFLLSEMKGIDCRIEQRIVSQEQRTDKLYEMFIDLLRDKKS